MNNVILAINSGSSSIKFSLYAISQADVTLLYYGKIEKLSHSPLMTVFNDKHQSILKETLPDPGHESGLNAFFNWLGKITPPITLQAVGHRVVHGGTFFVGPTLITDQTMQQMASLNSLAPLHQSHNLEAIKVIKTRYPDLPQIACFDTTFHRTQAKLAKLFAIPADLTNAGILRYGFHGISYEYIALVMQQVLGEVANKRVIVAHLGNGASLCGMQQRKSIATSMGFTALDGLMMGTRCGRIDPGVLLYLLQEKNYSAQQLEYLLYNESGLLGVSEISNDMRELINSDEPRAQQAVDLFCYRAATEVGSLAVALKGCDAIVFTAGIGEHAAIVREKICSYLNFLGVKINTKANLANAGIISEKNSDIVVAVIATDEALMIARHVLDHLAL